MLGKYLDGRWLTKQGFGVHSPWAYNFLESVINEKNPYYAYDDLFSFWQKAPEFLPQYPESTDKLLFRLANFIQPRFTLEFGTGAGVSTGYLAKVRSTVPLVTIDSPHPAVKLVKKNLSTFAQISYRVSLNPLEELNNLLEERLPLDFVHVAHTTFYKEVVNMALPYTNPRTLIVVQGMGKREKQEWWNNIIEDDRVGITFLSRRVGLLFFDKNILKQHYKI